ncbi:MAG: glycosyltransferase [Acidobacteriota bacterium]|nr:glycosyltransferase [Acidobacteriota bacterium]
MITVVVCTYDRPELLAACLASLARDASAPPAWELLLVDNGGREGTREVAARFAERLPLRFLREERVGKSFALNRALAEAQGELLLFADDDVEVRPGWMGAFVEAANRAPEAGWFGGCSLPRWGPGAPRWVAGDLPSALHGYVCHYDLGPEPRPYGDGDLAPIGACMAVRADTFAAIGGYDPGFGPRGSDRGIGDDTELIRRAREHRIPGSWVPAATVDHFVPASRLRVRTVVGYGIVKGRQQAMMEKTPRRFARGVTRASGQILRGAAQWLRGRYGNAAVCALNVGLALGGDVLSRSRQGER